MASHVKKGGLGRGLDALFADPEPEEGALPVEPSELRLSEIEPDRGQPRQNFDDESLGELANSIAEHGVLQPILVRPTTDGMYKIVAGERRWRASRIAGKTTIPAIVRDLTDMEAMTVALVENLQREDLNPVDEAMGYKQLMEISGFTQEQVAKRVGKSRPSVANAIRLLALPNYALDLLKKGDLTTGHAKAILSVEDDNRRLSLAQQIADEGLTVRDAEKLAQQAPKVQKSAQPKPRESTATEVELSLKEALGVEVKVKYKDGKGVLSVSFYSKDQLFEFANKLGN